MVLGTRDTRLSKASGTTPRSTVLMRADGMGRAAARSTCATDARPTNLHFVFDPLIFCQSCTKLYISVHRSINSNAAWKPRTSGNWQPVKQAMQKDHASSFKFGMPGHVCALLDPWQVYAHTASKYRFEALKLHRPHFMTDRPSRVRRRMPFAKHRSESWDLHRALCIIAF